MQQNAHSLHENDAAFQQAPPAASAADAVQGHVIDAAAANIAKRKQQFDALKTKGYYEKGHHKDRIIKHELRRFHKRIPSAPVVEAHRAIDRDICAYNNGALLKGTRVEAFHDYTNQWRPGVIAPEGSSTRRHHGGAFYHVLVVVVHDDGTKKAYRCECLRKLEA